jgi:2-polyprenyl-3-methyl-5-hydroxy-6-metoxy-1,4-benzoquinol methylase
MKNSQRKKAISEYEAAYSASSFEEIQARYRKKMLLGLLQEKLPKRLLEVGCGLDSIANHWQEFVQCTIVEPGKQFASQAQLSLVDVPGITIIEQFLEDSSSMLSGHKYDLILLSGLLHEVPDPLRILEQVKVYCHEKTIVHINVPNANSMHRLLAVEMGIIENVYQTSPLQQTLKQPRIFDLKQLSSLSKEAGFQVIQTGSYFVKPFTHQQMIGLINQGILTEKMLDGFWGLSKYYPDSGSEIFANLSL